MVIEQGKTWVGYQELIGFVFNDKLSEAFERTMKQGLLRQRNRDYDSWINKKIDGLVHILYPSIPADTIEKYSLPEETSIASLHLKSLAEKDAAALEYYRKNAITRSHAHQLATISGWLILMASLKRSDAVRLGYASTDLLYQAVIEIMADLCDGHLWKCSSLQVFKRKLKPFNQLFKKTSEQMKQRLTTKAYDSLISKKIGNDNSRKLTGEQKSLLIQIYSQPNKPSVEQVFSMYCRKAAEMIGVHQATGGAEGWDEKCLISVSTTRRFLMSKATQQIVYESRHGYQQYREKYEQVTCRIPAKVANGMWVMDGSPVHRYYVQNGKSYTRLNYFVILDAASWCVLGFYVSGSEDTESVKGSLRAACELTGYLPYQLQFDNSSALKSHEAQVCMNTLSNYVTPTAVGNARSKIIEPFFKQFNEQVLKFRKGYTASPVGSNRLDGKPNREALARDVKEKNFPSTEQAIQELHEDFKIWNHRVQKSTGKSPIEKYRESVQATKDVQRIYTDHHRVEAFYTMPGKYKNVKIIEGNGKTRTALSFKPQPYEYTNKGINYRVGGEKYEAWVQDVEFNADNIGRKFLIKYDPIEPGKALLYNSDQQPVIFNDSHVCALPKELFHMAIMDRQDGEAGRLASHLEAKKLQRQIVLERLTSHVDLTRLNQTYTEAITENAFDKNVLNAAKIDSMEQLIQGGDYCLGENRAEKIESRPSKKHLRWER